MVRLAEHQVQSVSAVIPRGRLIALDGLRGIAALVVVFHHLYQIARPFIEPTTSAWAIGSLWWLISATPIKLLSAGSEAVLVFFVLSGLVVPLPLLGKRSRDWLSFYVSRLLRIYLPVWASLVLAGIWINALPHPVSAVTPGSWTARTNATTSSIGLLFSEASLVRKSFSSNTVLWSLQWEIIFSLALPLFVFAATVVKRFWIVTVVVCFALTIVGKLTHVDALLYLPVFFLGTLVAVNLEALRSWAQRAPVHRHARLVGWSVTVASALAIVASWMLRPVLHAGTPLSDVVGSLTPIGALGLVVCAVAFGPVRSGLSMRVPQWLGSISFSLYLTHLPILVALVYLFGDRNWPLVGLVGIPLVLGFAYLFHRFVEAPSHRLAKRVGALASTGVGHTRVALRAWHVAQLADAR